MAELFRLRVAVETPQHAGLAAALDYESEQRLAPGSLVRVPLGRRAVPGVVWPGAPTETVHAPEFLAQAVAHFHSPARQPGLRAEGFRQPPATEKAQPCARAGDLAVEANSRFMHAR